MLQIRSCSGCKGISYLAPAMKEQPRKKQQWPMQCEHLWEGNLWSSPAVLGINRNRSVPVTVCQMCAAHIQRRHLEGVGTPWCSQS